ESVVAVLVPEPGVDLDLVAIEARVKESLAGFKRPKHIAVLPELPRNTMGKVQKNQLRDQFANLFRPAKG
ncbi:MAG: malonyl-CoA synthase, partial [Pseudorhodobacter sp.]|nr:malonyl-CoA synthase [Pseudorhodobacter sp.]